MGDPSSLSYKKILEIGLPPNFVKINEFFFSLESTKILKNYDRQYSELAHENWASSDKKNYFFY